jgi:hypothetical protein
VKAKERKQRSHMGLLGRTQGKATHHRAMKNDVEKGMKKIEKKKTHITYLQD